MVRVLTDEQFMLVTRKINFINARDAAILALLAYCGLRNGEICQLDWEDLTERGRIAGAVYVRTTKQGGEYPRTVDIPIAARKILENHLIRSVHQGHPVDAKAPVFCAERTNIRLQPRDLQRITAKHTLAALGRSYNPHVFRHTYATRLLRYTNTRIVQTLLGHKSLASTQIYTHPNNADTADAVKKAFALKG